MLNKKTLLNFILDIAKQAGEEIMSIYKSGSTDTTYKADNSPLTNADLISNSVISNALIKLTPNIPIISEESLNKGLANKYYQTTTVWMIDPLDGTKEFLKHNDEFTINIALIENGIPTLGVVYAPALDLLYYASDKLGAWKKTIGSDHAIKIESVNELSVPRIIVSRSHFDKITETWLKSFGPHELKRVGSSLKLCFLADNSADLYPKFGPINEWDIAAGDAILRESGGLILQTSDLKQPMYNKKDLKQQPFIAFRNTEVSEAAKTKISA